MNTENTAFSTQAQSHAVDSASQSGSKPEERRDSLTSSSLGPAKPGPRTFVFCGQDLLVPPGGSSLTFAEDTVLSDSAGSGSPWFPSSLLSGTLHRSYDWDGVSYRSFMIAEAEAQVWIESGCIRTPVRSLLATTASSEMRALLKGRALSIWLESALYCGACGSPLVDAHGQDSVGRICSACSRLHFPKISPAVITLVTKGDTILLARNARFPGRRFGLIAGFVEPGETLEETVHREVLEEAGIEVEDLVYRRSQPWPFPDSLMLAFTARWKSGEPVPDGEEIVEIRWCTRDDLPDIPPPGSVARTLIDDYLAATPHSRKDS